MQAKSPRLKRGFGVSCGPSILFSPTCSGVLHMCALRAPCQWVDSAERDELQFTVSGRLDRRAERMAHLTHVLSS